VPVGADHEAAVERGGDVVGVAFDPRSAREDLFARQGELEHVVRCHERSDDRSPARAETARQRDPGADSKSEAVNRVYVRERPDAEVGLVLWKLVVSRVDGERARLLDLELHVERDGRGE
jgi:hypothetical protein